MQTEWNDGFGTWTSIPEPEIADSVPVTFADEATVIGPSGPISAPDDPDDSALEWRDGFGEWASS